MDIWCLVVVLVRTSRTHGPSPGVHNHWLFCMVRYMSWAFMSGTPSDSKIISWRRNQLQINLNLHVLADAGGRSVENYLVEASVTGSKVMTTRVGKIFHHRYQARWKCLHTKKMLHAWRNESSKQQRNKQQEMLLEWAIFGRCWLINWKLFLNNIRRIFTRSHHKQTAYNEL